MNRTIRFGVIFFALWLSAGLSADQYNGTNTPDHERLQNLRAEDPVTFGILQYNTATMLSHGDSDEWELRANLIADRILALGDAVDIITFNEIMADDTRAVLINRLATNGPFHFFTAKLGDDDFLFQDSMLLTMSRFEIENGFDVPPSVCAAFSDCIGGRLLGEGRVFEEEFDANFSLRQNFPKCCQNNGGPIAGFGDDCDADKGVLYARVRHPSGVAIHVFNTHLQSGALPSQNNLVRECQLEVIERFMEEKVPPTTPETTGQVNDYVVLAGDLNFKPGQPCLAAQGIATMPTSSTVAGSCAAATEWALPADAFDGHNHETFDALGFRCGHLTPDSLAFASDSNCNCNDFPDRPGERASIDMIAYRAGHRTPRNHETRIMRFRAPWVAALPAPIPAIVRFVSNACVPADGMLDLSDHHPMLATFNADVWTSQPITFLTNAITTSAKEMTRSSAIAHIKDHQSILTGDFDGDERTDLVKIDDSGANDGVPKGVWVFLARTNTWTNWASADPPIVGLHTQFFTADVNGDQRSDLIYQSVDATCPTATDGCPSNLAVAIANTGCPSSGTATNSNCRFNNWVNFTAGSAWNANTNTKFLVGDYNGDGRADIAKIDTAAGTATGDHSVKVAISRFPAVSSFHVTEWAKYWNSSHYEYLAGDFTGDGRTDLLRIDRPSGGGACGVPFWLMRSAGAAGATTGSFTTDSGPWLHACTNEPDRARYLVANVPETAGGDLRADLISIDADSDLPSPKTMGVFRSNGTSFTVDILESQGTGETNFVNSSRCDKFLVGRFDHSASTSTSSLQLMQIPAACPGFATDPLANSSRPMTLFHIRGTSANYSARRYFVHAAGGGTSSVRRGDKVLSGDFNGDDRTDLVIVSVP